jgi:hypothetical protein
MNRPALAAGRSLDSLHEWNSASIHAFVTIPIVEHTAIWRSERPTVNHGSFPPLYYRLGRLSAGGLHRPPTERNHASNALGHSPGTSFAHLERLSLSISLKAPAANGQNPYGRREERLECACLGGAQKSLTSSGKRPKAGHARACLVLFCARLSGGKAPARTIFRRRGRKPPSLAPKLSLRSFGPGDRCMFT